MQLQTPFKPNLYASGLISDKYQILENEYHEFVVYDVVAQEMVAGIAGKIPPFSNLTSAMAYCSGKPVKAAKTDKQVAKPAKASKAAKPVKVSAVGMIFDLIRNTNLGDAEILAKVQESFPDAKSYNLGSVKRRRKMV